MLYSDTIYPRYGVSCTTLWDKLCPFGVRFASSENHNNMHIVYSTFDFCL